MTDNLDLKKVIAEQLKVFYEKRMAKLYSLRLKQILKRKNPYLYKAVGTQSATEVVESILSAYISSSDETIFGEAFFEPIAKAVSGGIVSPSKGIDIAIETKDKYLAISVKSGPNPFNASQKEKQNQEFLELRARLKKLGKEFDALLGHCYGSRRSESSRKVIYRARSGQDFWAELTGDHDFYLKLIRYIEEKLVLKHREEYRVLWQKAVNRYVREFTNDFCDESGAIKWEELLRFNSEAKKRKK